MAALGGWAEALLTRVGPWGRPGEALLAWLAASAVLAGALLTWVAPRCPDEGCWRGHPAVGPGSRLCRRSWRVSLPVFRLRYPSARSDIAGS